MVLAKALTQIVIYRDGLMRSARYVLWANGILQGQEEGRRAFASRSMHRKDILAKDILTIELPDSILFSVLLPLLQS